MSYFATYWTKHGGTMLGGVRKSKSSRFARREDAEARLESAIDINRSAGVEVVGRINRSDRPPEIFHHCGSTDLPAQAIGGRCFSCGKKLTRADAAAHAKGR